MKSSDKKIEEFKLSLQKKKEALNKDVKFEDFTFVDFKPIWKKLKSKMTNYHQDLFYDVVNIDGTCGRRIYLGCGREYNPRFYTHWFAAGRCHWNVILPCFMLNRDDFEGRFKIITNDKHSAIVDTLKKEIMCPTLNNKEKINDFFAKDFEIQELLDLLYTTLNSIDPLLKLLDKGTKNKFII